MQTDKKILNILFLDFWPSCTVEYLKDKNGFGSTVLKMLGEDYYLTYNKNPPDLIIYSVFGIEHKKYPNIPKILYTAEYTGDIVRNCRLSLSFFRDTATNFRLPNYERIHGFDCYHKLQKLDIHNIYKEKDRFCIFIVSNPNCKFRNNFFIKLSKYKKIDSCGKVYNNVDFITPPRDSDEYYKLLSRYKFMISFENQSQNNYLTEKIYNAMRGHTVPIYWGDPLVNETFNDKSFINVTENNVDSAIDKIIELDNDDDKYIKTLNEPYVSDSFIQKYSTRHNELKEFLICKLQNY